MKKKKTTLNRLAVQNAVNNITELDGLGQDQRSIDEVQWASGFSAAKFTPSFVVLILCVDLEQDTESFLL